ncbi:MAG: hypothetical protein WCS18_10775 [Sphaerochaetaceae bacterium]
MSAFDRFAGQEAASGVRKNEPLLAFEEEATATKLANIEAVQGLLPKIAKIIVHETRIKEGNLDAYFKKGSMPYGAGVEHIQFMDGAANAKNSGRCVPYGTAAAVGQLDVINLAWSLNISVWDREISQNVLSAAEVGDYVAQKLRTPYKTLAALKRSAEIQLVSDVIDGTRSVSGTESSDGTGNSVTYAPNIKGYAGQIEDTGIVMPALVQGTMPAFANGSDALSLCKTLQDHAAQMREEGTAYSKLGINTFCMEAPLLIMETRVLNAIDNAWALDGAAKQIPTKTAREFLRSFAEIVEIPAFAELPENASYTGKRLGAVLIDRDSLSEQIAWDNVESQRCVEQRMTGYNLAGASALGVYRGNPACGLLFSTE